MSLHHKIAHVLGGTAGLPHAETHAAVLPHALALVLPAVPAANAALRRALGTDSPERALWALGRRFAPELSLADIGLGLDLDLDLDRRMLPTIVARVESQLRGVELPAKIRAGGISELLERAFTGESPTR